MVSFLASLLFAITANASPSLTMICNLSIVQDGKLEPCGAIRLTSTDATSHGPRGKCADLSFLMGRFETSTSNRNEFLIMARSTKKFDNDEPTTITFTGGFPEHFDLAPHFTKHALAHAECSVTRDAQ